ncbi:MAG: NB-ARC domain-containing protein [Roseiarcus sp.]
MNAAAAKLGETLGDRRILMVIDDVWREQDLRPFLQGGRHCVRLVTTRIDSVLPQDAVRQKVDAMQAGEALALLANGLPRGPATRERASLQKLAARLGEWAILIKIVNGFLRNRVSGGEPLPVAIDGANRRLGVKGLTVFDPRDETERDKAIARTIGVSLDLLSKPERERFGELAVFPEDVDVPIMIVARLWAMNGGLQDFETDDLLGKLFDLSLLLERDLARGFLRLHDTVRHFSRDQAGKDRLAAQHKALVTILETPSQRTNERANISIAFSRITLPKPESARGWTRCCSTRRGCKQSSTRRAIRWDCFSTTSSTAPAKRRTSSRERYGSSAASLRATGVSCRNNWSAASQALKRLGYSISSKRPAALRQNRR